MAKFTKEHRAKLSAAAKARYAKKGKKRGRKPGVKVGPYKKRNKPMTLDDYSEKILKPAFSTVTEENNYNKLFAAHNTKFMEATKQYSPAPVLTLCGQLEDSVLLLENRISNVIAKLNSLM